MATTVLVGRPRRPHRADRPATSGAISIQTSSVLRTSAIAAGLAIIAVVAAVVLAVRLTGFDDWAEPPAAGLQQTELAAPAPKAVPPVARAAARVRPPARRAAGPQAARPQRAAGRTPATRRPRYASPDTKPPAAPAAPAPDVVAGPAPDVAPAPDPVDPVRDATARVERTLREAPALPHP